MPLLQWDQAFLVGVDKIDADHRVLVELINELHEQLKHSAPRTGIINRFAELYSHVTKHFAHEEAIMRSRNYDQYEVHQADHQSLLDEITTIMCDWEGNSGVNSEATTKRLYDWFSQHFQTHDARLHKLREFVE